MMQRAYNQAAENYRTDLSPAKQIAREERETDRQTHRERRERERQRQRYRDTET